MGRRWANTGAPCLCVYNHRPYISWVERIYKYKAGYALILSIKKQGIPCSLKNWPNHGIKGQILPITQKPKGSQIKIFEKKLYRASYIFIDEKKINMEPFISFRSETIGGDYTFIFDGKATETKQLLGKLAAMGALTNDTIEKLKDRGIL